MSWTLLAALGRRTATRSPASVGRRPAPLAGDLAAAGLAAIALAGAAAPLLAFGPAAVVPAPAGMTTADVLRPVPAPSSTTAVPAPPIPAPGVARSLPRLRVPAAGIDALIEAVGLDAQGRMAVPAGTGDVGWYRKGPVPGDPGDAVIDGHVDWPPGAGVFGRLAALRPGDRLTVEWAGRAPVTFAVRSLHTFAPNDHPAGLFAQSGGSRLSLVTCAGAWDAGRRGYSLRLVVEAERADAR